MTAGIREGDAIILTKGIAIEGTSLLCRESESSLLAAGIPAHIIAAGKKMLFEPGISVRFDAELAIKTVKVHGMHDATEGGVATGLQEMASASGLGLDIDPYQIIIFDESKVVCDALGLNPLGLISSGALLVATHPDDAPKLVNTFQRNNIMASIIGTATNAHREVRIVKNDVISRLEVFERDELARYYDQ